MNCLSILMANRNEFNYCDIDLSPGSCFQINWAMKSLVAKYDEVS